MKVKIYYYFKLAFLSVFLLFLLSENSFSQYHFNTTKEKIKYYKNRYKVLSLYDKITDNHGNGFETLYGTRNMRVILYGIAYRGGANNFYHRTNKRNNMNPLPSDALYNLKKEGFSTVIYLYNTNYNDSLRYYIDENSKDTLLYLQNSLKNRAEIKEMLLLVKETIENPNRGPIYLHCWNGWHQSGYASAIILMQFCNFTNEQALLYWRDNTDGVRKGYEKVEKKIAEFVPFEDIKIDNSIKKLICPCMK